MFRASGVRFRVSGMYHGADGEVGDVVVVHHVEVHHVRARREHLVVGHSILAPLIAPHRWHRVGVGCGV